MTARRTSSQLRFAAVAVALDEMATACERTFAKRRASARHVEGLALLPDSELAQLARYARGHAEGAVRVAYERGASDGRAQLRAELGLAPEGQSSPDQDTQRLGPCPIDGRACPVPRAAEAARKDTLRWPTK